MTNLAFPPKDPAPMSEQNAGLRLPRRESEGSSRPGIIYASVSQRAMIESSEIIVSCSGQRTSRGGGDLGSSPESVVNWGALGRSPHFSWP